MILFVGCGVTGDGRGVEGEGGVEMDLLLFQDVLIIFKKFHCSLSVLYSEISKVFNILRF